MALRRIGGHPNIVVILQDGWKTIPFVGEYYFIDMELCDLNLHDYIQGHRSMTLEVYDTLDPRIFVPPECDILEKMRNVWAIMIHISQGLEFLHQYGQVHRDLKPRNSKSILLRSIDC